MLDVPIAGEKEIEYHGCVINEMLNPREDALNHRMYAVRHLKTNHVIDVVSLVHARQVARLLELEYLVSQWIYKP